MLNCIICILILLVFIIIFRKCTRISSQYEMFMDFKKNVIVKKKNPIYEYEYLKDYFHLYYENYENKIKQKMTFFFRNVSIVFISLKRNKERLEHIHEIIKKYNLKNIFIINAIDYLKLKKKENRYFIINEQKNYYFDNIYHEKEKEIACTFSHLKAILFASSLKTPYTMIVEDDICFDYIPFSKYSIEELYLKLPDNKSYLSLYTNKPDYKKEITDLTLAHFSNGYYGAVSYVMNKEILNKIYEISKVSNDTFTLPKIEKTLYIADHYFGSLFKNYHLGSSILLPNNLFLSSSLHNEKDKDHIIMQYKYIFELYKKVSFSISIPKYIILLEKNPYKDWYSNTYSNYILFFVNSFQEGIFFLKKRGGIFIFDTSHQIKLPLIHSFITCSPYYIISIPNHPYLKWIQINYFVNIETNHFLNISLEPKDYEFIEEPLEEKFIFIIPSYNNEQWVEKNLSSIVSQKKKNWFIYYIDDCSTDNTINKLYRFIKDNNIESKIEVIRNKKRMFQAYSRYIGYQKTNENDILLFLDGDDWLYNENVLHILEKQYNKGYVCTYGTAIIYRNGTLTEKIIQKPYPKNIIIDNSYRSYLWKNCHLRTCRSYLIKSIPEKQLKDKDGKWLEHSTDMAEWLWILERSGGNIKWIQDILYIYNKDNSLNHTNSWFYNSNDKNRKDIMNYIRSHK